ncbi:hypothetical protein F4803DRAFT_350471 [Xylaria telfairii]|nr:hypothetical protein F4803DRAFT_350471 [Xylaria telfairii]
MPPFIGAQYHKTLVPARNSRHRTACLALYRALLRLAPQVSLPGDLARGWGAGKNPITIHIRRAFRRNVADTSPRIVYPALSAGYGMISVLHAAATQPTSTHHASVITFLQSRLAERQRSLANRPPPPTGPKPGSPRPGTLPLLVQVAPATHGRAAVYRTPHRPRPQSELGGTGRRQIPRLDVATDFPFLRLTKPQPAVLSRVLRQKGAKRVARMELLITLEEEHRAAAVLEDEWDAEISRLARAENRDSAAHAAEGGPSHMQVLHTHGIKNLHEKLTRERADQVARADAMRLLIIEEKALAAAEKAQRAVDKRTRWEARMRDQHGEAWRDLFPGLKDQSEGKKPLRR